MSEHAELGPLDVQLIREDEFGRFSSGLDVFQALSILNAQAFQTFEMSFLKIKSRSGGSITTKTAADIATSLAVQLLSPISAQIPHNEGFLDCLTRLADEKENSDAGIIEEADDTSESGGVSDGSADQGTIQTSRNDSQSDKQRDQSTSAGETNGRGKGHRANTITK